MMPSLDALFAPRAVAVLGVSRQPGKLGHRLLQNVIEGVSRQLGGPDEPTSKFISFPAPKFAQNRCVDVPVRVPADTLLSGARKLRFKLTVTTQNGATVLAVVWGRTEPV